MNRGTRNLALFDFGLPGVVEDFKNAVWFGSDVGHALAVTARGIISWAYGERGERVWNSTAPQDIVAVQAAFGRAAMNLAQLGLLQAGPDVPRRGACQEKSGSGVTGHAFPATKV